MMVRYSSMMGEDPDECITQSYVDGDGENAYDFTWVMDENEEDENTEMFICDNGEEIPTDWVNEYKLWRRNLIEMFDDNTTYFMM